MAPKGLTVPLIDAGDADIQAYKDGILHIVGHVGCAATTKAVESAVTLELHGAIAGFRPVRHGTRHQFRAWLFNHPHGRKNMPVGKGREHEESPFCWIEWSSGKTKYIGGIHQVNNIEEIVSRPGSPFVPRSASPTLTRQKSISKSSMPPPKFLGSDSDSDEAPPIMDSKLTTPESLPWPLHIARWLVVRMSSAGSEPGKARLITFPYSHYCERARWVLSMTPLQFTEDGHTPGLHVFETMDASNGKQSATPVLLLPEGEMLLGSGHIIESLVERFPSELGTLYPARSALDIISLEKEMEFVIGSYSRQVAYTFLLDKSYVNKMAPYLSKGTSKIESFIFSLIYPVVTKGMVKSMRCFKSRLPKAEKDLDVVFEKLGRRLSGHREYLCDTGEFITAADITFAALAYPILLPPEMSSLTPSFDELPEGLQKIVTKYRSTPAGQHALKIYRRHRFKSGAERLLIPSNEMRDDGYQQGVMIALAGLVLVLLLILAALSRIILFYLAR